MAALEYGALAVSMGALGLVAKLVFAKRNGTDAGRVNDNAARMNNNAKMAADILTAKEATEVLTTLRQMSDTLRSINTQLSTRTFCPYDARRTPGGET
jgi:hypothetical protein